MRTSLLTILLLLMTQITWASAQIEHWSTPQGSRVYYVQSTGLPMVDIQA